MARGTPFNTRLEMGEQLKRKPLSGHVLESLDLVLQILDKSGLAQDLSKPRLEKSTYRRDGNSVRSLPSFFSSRPHTHQTFPSKGTAFNRVTQRLLAWTTGNRHVNAPLSATGNKHPYV